MESKDRGGGACRALSFSGHSARTQCPATTVAPSALRQIEVGRVETSRIEGGLVGSNGKGDGWTTEDSHCLTCSELG